jgi:hypothetical protein
MRLNRPSLSPHRKVCLFSAHRSTAPKACASQPRQSVSVCFESIDMKAMLPKARGGDRLQTHFAAAEELFA